MTLRKEVGYWLRQAKADLKSSKDLLKSENYYASVFFSHQTAEKALKSLYIYKKKKSIRGHNLVFFARELGAPEDVVNACAELTPDYLTTRYPDASTGPPFENYTKESAERHLKMAKEVFLWTKKEMKK
ncbi:MAG: HEPN domain-containing protein [Candidatus Methanofastidiosia archaeon]